MFPPNLRLPMVAPDDLARAALERLLSPADDVGHRHVEGPARYTFADVAQAFAVALDRPVELAVTPRDRWEQAYRDQSFSPAAARAYARMTAASVDHLQLPDDPVRGTVTLETYIRDLAARS